MREVSQLFVDGIPLHGDLLCICAKAWGAVCALRADILSFSRANGCR
jgi:hypothetical protein